MSTIYLYEVDIGTYTIRVAVLDSLERLFTVSETLIFCSSYILIIQVQLEFVEFWTGQIESYSTINERIFSLLFYYWRARILPYPIVRGRLVNMPKPNSKTIETAETDDREEGVKSAPY